MRGEGSPEQGVPRWCKLRGGERRWWSRGTAENASKGVEGAPSVGVELEVVVTGPKCGWSGPSAWRCLAADGELTVEAGTGG
jgi:hypothetical protein